MLVDLLTEGFLNASSLFFFFYFRYKLRKMKQVGDKKKKTTYNVYSNFQFSSFLMRNVRICVNMKLIIVHRSQGLKENGVY